MNIYHNSFEPFSQTYYHRYIKFIEYFSKNPATTESAEEHHILPRSMGGDDSSNNLVLLSPKGHLIAHHLLWRAYRNAEMASAFWFMSHIEKDKQWIKITAREYQKLKEDKSKFQKEVGSKVMTGLWSTDRTFMVEQLIASWTEERRGSVSGDNNVAKRLKSREKISDELLGRKMAHKKIDGVIVTKRVHQNEFEMLIEDGWTPGHGAGNNPPTMIGNKHPRVKKYLITSPHGVQHIVDYSLRQFCQEQGISDSAFRKISFDGAIQRGPATGWVISPT